jgi:hypothetical protein
MMRKPVLGLALAAALMDDSVADAANAAEIRGTLQQGAAITTDLGGNASAVTYWVSEADGWEVVTTVDTVVSAETRPDEARHAIVRFSSLIQPGQSQVISVPGPIGSRQQALRIRRLGDRIEVARIAISASPTERLDSKGRPWRSRLRPP